MRSSALKHLTFRPKQRRGSLDTLLHYIVDKQELGELETWSKLGIYEHSKWPFIKFHIFLVCKIACHCSDQ